MFLMMAETKHIPYVDNVVHKREEVGNVSSDDLVKLILGAPKSYEPAYFSMKFLARCCSIPKSSGKLNANGVNSRNSSPVFYVQDVKLFDEGLFEDFENIIRGGKLETLAVDFPGSQGGIELLWSGGTALQAFKFYLPILMGNGYELKKQEFTLAHHVVRTKDAHPGFFSTSIAGKLAVTTTQMVLGEEPMKLVFAYTHDVMQSPEFTVYKGLVDEIRQSKVG